MDPQRWKQIDELLDAVIDLDPDKRAAFLDDICAGDDRLRKEVEVLLAADQRAGSFIELPALHPDAEFLAQRKEKPSNDEEMDSHHVLSLLGAGLNNEATLHERQVVAGRYEILSKLGTGGMGEVWHAHDVKLRVDVALKTLRLGLSGRHDPVEAFRREVRSAREVISPNVCRIFDLVEVGNQEFISMEYVDGMTLITMLQQKGPIQLSEARDIAAQFLAGLEAIHRAGVVHCDLKPENIMITRTGRVVVMDFGIAKEVKQTGAMISGTLPYMSPEQVSGQAVDVRTDVYSAGVILAEMIHPTGITGKKTRDEIWNAVHKDPQQLPDSPWKAVILRAVASDPEFRFASAQALSRALEEATERIETIEESKPYPGLSSFTTGDAEYFFGRELEVETLIKKFQQNHLMGLIGPSGAGKTSLLRAGLVPTLPEGWAHVLCQPGDAPMINLGQSLLPEFSGDTEAIQKLVQLEDLDVALLMLRSWRQNHPEALLIVDRFEELFTLNSTEVQARFAGLIGQAVMEADVHVLLVMRDDFLIFCREHSSLAPIFSELTAMLPLTGAALRRALVQPALKCGYRFEDETLVGEIIADVEKERGALPLMAFAASRLWDKRNRAAGLLTRDAYRGIGGVEGALAQHAETTMERIGTERLPIVREIFSNLITAQNTRAARDAEDLLSVFANRKDAEEALRMLIDARLLTSFEAPQVEGETPRRRVEIIHESLLTAWPRLIRWQTQDVDSAQLRDQLRQASQLWEQRSRSEDLLWTGTAFLEFQAWRQRYPGGLTTTEEAFSHAMVQRASKRRRQRWIAVAAMFVVLLGVLAVISNFWRKATVARDDAVAETRRAEAGRVLAIGRAIPEADPSTKLAYALASLEFADTPQARSFALQALSEGPPAHAMEMQSSPPVSVQFSPDGKWTAVTGTDGTVQLVPRDGTAPVTVSEPFKPNYYVPWNSQFSPDSEFLLWTWRKDPSIVKVWSISQKKLVRTFSMEGLTMCQVRGGKAFLITDTTGRREPSFNNWNQSVVRTWRFDREEPEVVGRLNLGGIGWKSFDIDSRGRSIAYKKGKGVYIRSLDTSQIGAEKLVGYHTVETEMVRFNPNGSEIASADSNAEIRLWSVVPGTKNPIRVISGNSQYTKLWFGSSGSLLFALRGELFGWDLTAPIDAEPFVFSHLREIRSVSLENDDRWMSIVGGTTLAFYPMTDKYPYIFRNKSSNIRFTPDGKNLVSGFLDGRVEGIRIWSMPGEKQLAPRNLWSSKKSTAESIDVDPLGRYVLVATGGDGVHLISIPDGKDLTLKGNVPNGFGFYTWATFSPDGNSAAALGKDGIEIWDLQSGRSRILEKNNSYSLKYSPDGTLFSGGDGNLYQWNLKNDSAKILGKGKAWVSGIAVSNTGRYVVACTWSAKDLNGMPNATSELVLYDLKEGKSFPISSHGNRVFCVAFDPSGTRLVTGDYDGIVRVGPITGEPPHLLLGHESSVHDIVVHPAGQWIASIEDRGTVRLWRMPEGKPFSTLPYNELLNRLRVLTNVRAVVDKASSTGYRIRYAPFPGWEKAGNW